MMCPNLVSLNSPMYRTVELIEVEKLVEPPDSPLGNFAWIINVEAVDGWIESSVSPACEAVEILDPDQLKRLLEKGVVVECEEVGAPEIAVPRDQLRRSEERRVGEEC